MVISFDLDDTLIPGIKTFPAENQTFIQRMLKIERLRFGTIELFRELRLKGYSVCIYTSSFRSVRKIRWMFLSYGLWVDQIINKPRHDKAMSNSTNRSSKFPPAFGIDIHVDDSLGLKLEAEKFNFRAIIVNEKDNSWTKFVLKEINY